MPQIFVPGFLSSEVDCLAPESNFSIWLRLKKCRISLLHFYNYIFMMKLSSWRKTELWKCTFSISPGCEVQGRALWQQSPASLAPGRDGSAQAGSADHWSNELRPCDPLLQGLSSLEKDNTNVYSKFFLERSIKTRSCLRVTSSSVSGLPCLFLQMANFSTGQKNLFTLARTLGGCVLHLL